MQLFLPRFVQCDLKKYIKKPVKIADLRGSCEKFHQVNLLKI